MARLLKKVGERRLYGRTFYFGKRTITATGNKTPEDLADISQKFMKFLRKINRTWPVEWRWCENRECINSFATEGWKLRKKDEKRCKCCSVACTNLVYPRRRGAAAKIEKEEKIKAIMAKKKAMEGYINVSCSDWFRGRGTCFSSCGLKCKETCKPPLACPDCPCPATAEGSVKLLSGI